MPSYFASSCIPFVFSVVLSRIRRNFDVVLQCTMCFPCTSCSNLVASTHNKPATQLCSPRIYITAPTFPIPVLSSAIPPIAPSRRKADTQDPKPLPQHQSSTTMTKTHHCPGKKTKIQGLPGNCRPGAGIATGSCATHQTVCTNIVDGRYCKGKHMKNEPCRQCGKPDGLTTHVEAKAAGTKVAGTKRR